MTDLALAFRDVTVRYDPETPPTLSTVSFALKSAERVALVGLNGSGKTTLLGAAVGLVPHHGEIRIADEVLTRRTVTRIRDRVGFVFNVPEDQLLFPTVLEDVAFGLLRRGVSRSEATARTRQQLQALGLHEFADVSVHQLSHGQKQRVALAGALVTEPSLLLLDEPTAGLDPPGKRTLSALLSRLDAALLLATHDLEFAARLCTRYVMLDKGRIVFDGTDWNEVSRRWES